MALGLVAGAEAKTLVYCSEGSPSSFNPQLETDGTSFDASSRQLYNRLAEFERGTTKIVPALAESWSVTEDGLEYTFNLRRGVNCGNGSDIRRGGAPGTMRQRGGQACGRYGQTAAGCASAEVPVMKEQIREARPSQALASRFHCNKA